MRSGGSTEAAKALVSIQAWPENNQRPRRGIDYSSFPASEVYGRADQTCGKRITACCLSKPCAVIASILIMIVIIGLIVRYNCSREISENALNKSH